MNIFHNIFNKTKNEKAVSNQPFVLIEKFDAFMSVLESNNQALKIISDIEEKTTGEFIYDINYINNSIENLNKILESLIAHLIELGGKEYESLGEKFKNIQKEILNELSEKSVIPKDEFTIPFSQLDKNKSSSVGSKNAQLGELRNILNIPVPDGFAVSAWAYKYFLDSNDLQNKITNILKNVDIKNYSGLEKISNDISSLILNSEIPEDLSQTILNSHDNLMESVTLSEVGASPIQNLVSVRSSAIGEDSKLSFAGQYSTCLGVKKENLIGAYLKVIASKFSPKAIYYYLSHELAESDLAMSIGCVSMVNARSSGVIYTSNPVNPDDNNLLINSIFGIGKLLVDGTITPDQFIVSKSNYEIVGDIPAYKEKKLILNKDGDVSIQEIPESNRNDLSANNEEIRKLAELAIKIEEHYGCPQDIEWAIDENNNQYILQTRPLNVIKKKLLKESIDTSNFNFITKSGTTASPGAGIGTVHHVKNTNDLESVPESAVIVAEYPFPGLITALSRASALITKVGGVASHLITIAREYRIPTIVGFNEIEKLVNGTIVTVDAANCIIYKDSIPELADALKPDNDFEYDITSFNILEKISGKIAPINLTDSRSPDFIIENCKTVHDILRFAHQKAIEEMFSSAKNFKGETIPYHLKSDIPLPVDIISIDESYLTNKKRNIAFENINSVPFESFWEGIENIGWTLPPAAPDMKSFMTVMATDLTTQKKSGFAEKSYVICSKEYMVLSLRMGYHFSTIEAMCTEIPNKNFIRLRFKEGGATFERRLRRIKLLESILSKLGFECSSKGDAFESEISYLQKDILQNRLFALGQLTMLTKQLDMALSDDYEMESYKKDILEKIKMT
ncbi:MAG: PEP-utilizing enzyme [Bacteroidetes bacterium]|nr:PEP-utilizing enzyme [Bacteroidota bacterium]